MCGNQHLYHRLNGFCKFASLQEICQHGYVLTPGRYVGAAPKEEDAEPFEQKMARLTAEWQAQAAQARQLDEAIWKNLKELGYGRYQS